MAALGAALVLFAAVALRLAAGLEWGPALALLAGAALAGYLASDLLSGTVHWFCDSFFSEDTPGIGNLVIRPFRDHHRHPSAITRYRLLEQDSTNYLILVPLLATALASAEPSTRNQLATLRDGVLCGFAAGALGTNLFHKWAHADRVPPGVRWLQRRRLILSPDLHQVHHRRYTGGYCVTSGWMNALLDRIDFFPWLEGSIRRLLRLPRPQAHQ